MSPVGRAEAQMVRDRGTETTEIRATTAPGQST